MHGFVAVAEFDRKLPTARNALLKNVSLLNEFFEDSPFYLVFFSNFEHSMFFSGSLRSKGEHSIESRREAATRRAAR